MTFFDKLERRIGWISFPSFLRYYALFHVLVFVLRFIRPDIGQLLEFDRAKIFSGEVWRVVTFFFAGSSVGTPSIISIIFLACVVNFIFMVSDGLEGAWGVFKTTLFYYTGIALLLALNFIYPTPLSVSGFALYGSAFFAFATLFPKVEVQLMMILPVQVRILAFIQLAALVLMVADAPKLLPFVLIAFANYLFWAGIPAMRGTARVLESAQRKRRFQAAKRPTGDEFDDSGAFHNCVVCRRNDLMDPEMEFRIGGDGKEYCANHLPE